jgi:hypothetical protein
MPNITSDLTSVIGGSGYDSARSVAVGADGSIYVAGVTSKSFDSQLLVGDTNAFLSKFSASGNKLWTKFIGTGSTEARSISVGTDGSLYLAGWTSSVTLTGDSGSDGFVSKISTDGSLIWNKNINSFGGDRVEGISASSDGSIYLTGKISTPATINSTFGGQKLPSDSSSLFIQKISADGTSQWTALNSFTNTFTSLLSVSSIFADSNYVYVCGATDSNLNGQINSGGGSDAFILKYSTSGNLIWSKLLKSAGRDTATAITSDSSGNIYVVGYVYSNSNINFENQQSSATSGAFLTKIDSSGSSSWTRLLSGGAENSYGVTVLSDGSIWVTGNTTSNLGAQGQTNAGETDGFICKYDSDGNKVISYLLGTSNADFAFAIASNKSSSKFYVVGETYGALGGTKFGNTDAYLMGGVLNFV